MPPTITKAESWRTRRARLAALTRHRPADDPAVVDAGRDLVAERLAEHVRRIVDTFPPLTAEQRDRIAVLLWTPARGQSQEATGVRIPTQRSAASP